MEKLDEFRAYLTRQGLKFTKQRRAVAEVFFLGQGHPSLPDLLVLAKEREPSIGYATVYRTMKLLTESGLASEYKFGDASHARFEPHEHDHHHDHLICLDCGRIVEFEDPVVERHQDRVATERGFEVAWHRHEIYARCTKPMCEGKREA